VLKIKSFISLKGKERGVGRKTRWYNKAKVCGGEKTSPQIKEVVPFNGLIAKIWRKGKVGQAETSGLRGG